MNATPSRPVLTDNQQRQLQALRYAGALSADSAVGPFDGARYFNNMVLGRLQTLGLTRSRILRSGARRADGSINGSQQTLYWLTDAGLERTA